MTKRKRRSPEPAERWVALADLGLTVIQRRILLSVGSLAAVLAAALLLTLLVDAFTDGRGVPVPAPEGALGRPRPDSYQAWPSLKEFAPIADRKADPAPLTGPEVLAARTLTAAGITLRRVATRVDTDCAGAVWGVELADALAEAGCTQAVRGLYRTTDGVYQAQYTLFNLADVRAANALVEALATVYRGGWVLPLQPGSAAFTGYSESSGHAMGHYLGLVWLGRADGAEPGERDDFVMLGLAVRGVEKALYRRIVSVAGLPAVPTGPGSTDEPVQPTEPAPTDP